MYRSEYPRPQFVRQECLNLNGEWAFEFDDARVGIKENWPAGDREFTRMIQVPFSYESRLSGIEERDVHDVVWYQRSFRVPTAWQDKEVVIHFGAVDYSSSVWVNGILVITHEGGHTPFTANITHALRSGENLLVVRAEDDARDVSLPRGKQYWKNKSEAIFYTRTTGIWQTVWLEAVSPLHLDHVNLTPDIDRNTVQVKTFVNGLENFAGHEVRLSIEVSFNGEIITSRSGSSDLVK